MASTIIRVGTVLITMLLVVIEFSLALQIRKHPGVKSLWIIFGTILIGLIIFAYFFLKYMEKHPIKH